jgi:hypothetical protein
MKEKDGTRKGKQEGKGKGKGKQAVKGWLSRTGKDRDAGGERGWKQEGNVGKQGKEIRQDGDCKLRRQEKEKGSRKGRK